MHSLLFKMSLIHEVNIKGDGNCLYRCFSYSLFNKDQEKHFSIRQCIVDYVRSHKKEKLCGYVASEEELDKWCEEQSANNVYGDEVTISAFNRMCGTPVVVHLFDVDGNKLEERRMEFNHYQYNFEVIKPLILIHRVNHFNLIDDQK